MKAIESKTLKLKISKQAKIIKIKFEIFLLLTCLEFWNLGSLEFFKPS